MAGSVLSLAEYERFCMLRNALAIFAHPRLERDSPLLGRAPRAGDPTLYEQEMGETLLEVWQTPAIIDEFISQNPLGLGRDSIAALALWKSAHSSRFIVFKHEGSLLFFDEGYLFEVCGLSQPIENVLPDDDFPQVVQATLLPFAGHVVYDGFLWPLPISMGQDMKRIYEEEFEHALASAERISSAQRLVEVAPEIAQQKFDREARRMLEDLELDAKADEQMEGTHKGALAGLSEEEREEAIRASLPPIDASALAKVLKSLVTKGAPTRSLAKIIATEPKRSLQRWARLCGSDTGAKGLKEELVAGLVPALQESPLLLDASLHVGFAPREFRRYRSFYEAGGWLEVPEQDLETRDSLPPVYPLLCYLFYTPGAKRGQGTFTFSIPEEFMGLLGAIDWDEAEQYVDLTNAAVNVTEALAELRGVLPLQDAFDEYTRLYPEALEDNFVIDQWDMVQILEMVADGWGLNCAVLDAPEGMFVLSQGLADYYREEAGLPRPSFDNPASPDDPLGCFIEGPLDPLEYVLAHQEGKPGRTLDEGLLSFEEVLQWKSSLPAVCTLRSYLDEHVPDGENDRTFADEVIDELVDFMAFGPGDAKTVRTYFEILEDHGLKPDEAHLKRLLDLLMNMTSAMPCWINNGWAPAELHDAATGRKTFYNPDGSVMKVGRNDPCPCGSGKKYKKCCGK